MMRTLYLCKRPQINVPIQGRKRILRKEERNQASHNDTGNGPQNFVISPLTENKDMEHCLLT